MLPTKTLSQLSQRDKSIIWHPFTQEKNSLLPTGIKSAKGSYLIDEKGKSYLDLISSWWVNLHGHAHPYIAEAIYEQAKVLEHVMFAGFTHEPAVQLCENLQPLLPNKLNRFFFSDNGSTAVEIALKMAFQFYENQGQSKPMFLSFSGGYHGDTFGAMSVGAESGFHNTFKPLLFEVLSLPYPDTWVGDQDIEEKEQKSLQQLETYLKKYINKISAFILEPLVQGASGMRMCRISFLKQVIQKVKEANILVIFDEVMTGFCRTGTYFALDQLDQLKNEEIDLTPDFLCLSKGLTGGFLPLALTITHQNIYEGFFSDGDLSIRKTFLHGHTFTANPLGCAAAIASLTLLKKEETQKQIQTLIKTQQTCLEMLSEKFNFSRQCGTIAAFDLPSQTTSDQIKEFSINCLEKGFLVRPLRNTIYLIPPYCIKTDELMASYQIIETLGSNIC